MAGHYYMLQNLVDLAFRTAFTPARGNTLDQLPVFFGSPEGGQFAPVIAGVIVRQHVDAACIATEMKFVRCIENASQGCGVTS